jgi:hypothetical protein
MHNPRQVNGMHTTVGMIPKKYGAPLSLHLTTEGWGLRGQQGISAQKIIAWIGALTIISLLFAGNGLVMLERPTCKTRSLLIRF